MQILYFVFIVFSLIGVGASISAGNYLAFFTFVSAVIVNVNCFWDCDK